MGQLVHELFEDDVGCESSEVISFYMTRLSFLVAPREDLLMPWNFRFDETRRVSCLAFDTFAYIKAKEFFECSSNTAENPEDIGLTIWFCMCSRITELRLLKNEVSSLKT